MVGPSRLYFDANASEALRPAARDAMLTAFAGVGNPASVHGEGRAARRVLEAARDGVARRVGVAAAQVVFTSGGTEANVLAIHALGRGRRVLVGATEHDAVRRARADAESLPVGADGRANLAALADALAGPPALVCLMLVNNETGVIHPIAEAASLCHAAGAWLHVDAVQAAGRLPLEMAALGADSLAISSHKIGGPAGGGAWIGPPDLAPNAMFAGGGQERGWRGGTPPIAVLAGFAAAWEAAQTPSPALRDRLEEAARACGATVAGEGAPRVGNTSCLILPGVAAQTQVMALDLAGISVSAGAACSSGRIVRSHVLEAMGLGPAAGEAIRVSLSWATSEKDVDAFIAAYAAMTARLARRAA